MIKQENYRPISLLWIKTQKSSTKYSQTESSNKLKRSYTVAKWDLSQESKGKWKSINIPYQSWIRDRNHIIILVDTEEAFDKIKHSFMIKTLKKVGMVNFLKIRSLKIKSLFFPLKSETEARISTFTPLFNIVGKKRT